MSYPAAAPPPAGYDVSGAQPGGAPPGYAAYPSNVMPGQPSAPVGYAADRAAAAPPPMQQSAPQYFTSPSLEAAGKAGAQGQAAYNEQDEFNDPQGKYKLVMKGTSI